jgi:hypothetical protein
MFWADNSPPCCAGCDAALDVHPADLVDPIAPSAPWLSTGNEPAVTAAANATQRRWYPLACHRRLPDAFFMLFTVLPMEPA